MERMQEKGEIDEVSLRALEEDITGRVRRLAPLSIIVSLSTASS
jgi:hypothetical protein